MFSIIMKRVGWAGPGVDSNAFAALLARQHPNLSKEIHVKRDLFYVKRDLFYVKRDLFYVATCVGRHAPSS